MLFRHLEYAMRLADPKGAAGMCFQRSYALALDLPGSSVCIGTFRAATRRERKENPAASRVPFIHAWVEWEGYVFAPTTIERFGKLQRIDRDPYYRANDIKDVRVLHPMQLSVFTGKHNLSTRILREDPQALGREFVVTLLREAGVEWKYSKQGGIIPAGIEE